MKVNVGNVGEDFHQGGGWGRGNNTKDAYHFIFTKNIYNIYVYMLLVELSLSHWASILKISTTF